MNEYNDYVSNYKEDLMDLLEAFDKVNHSLFLHKLNNYRIGGGKGNSWIKSFSTNRTKALVINGEKSTSVAVESEVPQGSGFVGYPKERHGRSMFSILSD